MGLQRLGHNLVTKQQPYGLIIFPTYKNLANVILSKFILLNQQGFPGIMIHFASVSVFP